MATNHVISINSAEFRAAHRAHADDRIVRYTLTERLLHWWTVSMMAVALGTGVIMGPETEGGTMFNAHVISVVLIGVGVVVAIVFGNTMAVLRSVRDVFVPDRTDVEWVKSCLRHPFKKTGIRWGKFNLGQKGLAWMMLVSLSAVIYTGVRSWQTGGDLAGPHTTAIVALALLLAAHVFMAVVNPLTRPALPGMIFGHVRRDWAVHHHAQWVEDQESTHLSSD